jgi:hypothetical protein
MVVIEVVCTDRMGKRLASHLVQGGTYKDTLPERQALSQAWIAQHTDSAGNPPYIFRNVKRSEAYYERQG